MSASDFERRHNDQVTVFRNDDGKLSAYVPADFAKELLAALKEKDAEVERLKADFERYRECCAAPVPCPECGGPVRWHLFSCSKLVQEAKHGS